MSRPDSGDQLDVTVVLPTYNSLPYVHDQVASILGQTHAELRLIICDDGSTDGTFESLRAAYADRTNVELRRNDRNLGQLATLERLLRDVDTPLFAISDHDDVWKPSKIADTVGELLATGTDLCYADLAIVGPELEPVADSALRYSRMPTVRGRRPLAVLVKNPVHGCTIVARRALLDAALPFPPDLPDYDRWLALVAASCGGLSVVARPLVRYRQHDANTIGALPFSLEGLHQRAGGRSGPALRAFAHDRLASRAVYLRALSERTGIDRPLDAMRRLLALPRVLRVPLLPAYLALVSIAARELSWRTRLVDAGLVALAPRRPPDRGDRHRIVTLDERGLDDAARALAVQVEGAGYAPTHLVAIASAGVDVARHLAHHLGGEPVIVEIAARRPTTRLKRSRALKGALARLPRWLTTVLRHVEYRLVTGRSTGERTVSMEPAQLRGLTEHRDGTIRALLVDDCVDSGLSLEACMTFLRPHLGTDADLRAAVLAVSLPDPRVEPDFSLYRNTTVRGPWSIDA